MTPPPAPGERKGLSPLAWTGIGCGSLAIIAIAALAFVFGWGMRQASEFADKLTEYAEDPVALVELIASQSPDVEIVSKDEAAETITIRNNADGTEITVDYKDLRDGNLSFINADGEFNFEMSSADGSLTIETPDAKTVVGSNTATSDLPAWVPVYPGAVSQAIGTTKLDGGKTAGLVTFTTSAPVADVAAWMRETLEKNGFTTSVTTTRENTVIFGESTTDSRSVTSTLAADNDKTTIETGYQNL